MGHFWLWHRASCRQPGRTYSVGMAIHRERTGYVREEDRDFLDLFTEK